MDGPKDATMSRILERRQLAFGSSLFLAVMSKMLATFVMWGKLCCMNYNDNLSVKKSFGPVSVHSIYMTLLFRFSFCLVTHNSKFLIIHYLSRITTQPEIGMCSAGM